MFRITSIVLFSLFLLPAESQAQYDTEERDSPWFGGPGDYVYPMVCGGCSSWQHYRNFAWNQLSVAGGSARTPMNPGNLTVFRIFSDPSNDRHPVVVAIALVFDTYETVGGLPVHELREPTLLEVTTTTEQGDVHRIRYSPYVGPLYVPDDPGSGADNPGAGTGGGGGGENPGGGGGIVGGGGGGEYPGGGGGRRYCGPGTNYICVQIL